ncbi:MAG: GFA family protein [Burkholderiales bacterium]
MTFEFDSALYYPYQWCYCEICRKTNGSPVSCNIKAWKKDFRVLRGEAFLKMYCAVSCERYFCSACGSQLFILEKEWPDGVWPNAAAIDTPLPACPEHTHIFVRSKVAWFPILVAGQCFEGNPEFSIEDFHTRHGWPV